MKPVATERVKSGRPDDTKLPVLKFGIEEAAEVAEGIRYLPFRAPDKVRPRLLLYILKGVRIVSFDSSLYTRRYPRRHYAENIEFRLDYSGAATRLHGISVNISDSGIGIFTFEPIYRGQTVTFETTLPVQYQKAAVMWVEKRSEDFYKAGLNFITVATEGATV